MALLWAPLILVEFVLWAPALYVVYIVGMYWVPN